MDYKLVKLAEAGDVEAMKQLAMYFEKKSGHKRTIHVGESISTEEFFKEMGANKKPGDEELNAKSYYWWRQAAEAGDPESMTEVARRLYDGIGVEKNEEESNIFYRKGAEAGDIQAMRVVAFKSKEPAEKFKWYYKAAQLGDERSIKEVAIMFGVGEGTEQSDDKAEEWLAKLDEKSANEAIYSIGKRTNSIRWLERAAEASPTAMIGLAEKYIDKDDFEKALACYKSAAFAGSIEGMNRAGDIYYIGEGNIPQNYEEAFKFYQMGADEGDNMAAIKLAQLYYYGHGVTQDFDKAFKIFYEVATRSESFICRFNGVAKYFVARMYERGEGVKQNFEKAFKFYRKAAGIDVEPDACGTSTVPEAIYKVADFYYMGLGTKQNFEKALETYIKSYEDTIGFSHYRIDAANKITMMYKLGQGVPKDLDKAKNWREDLKAEHKRQFEESQAKNK